MVAREEVLDTLGLLCPVPIIKTAQRIKQIPIGGTLIVLSNDVGILQDLPAWCRSHGQEMLSIERSGTTYRAAVVRRK